MKRPEPRFAFLHCVDAVYIFTSRRNWVHWGRGLESLMAGARFVQKHSSAGGRCTAFRIPDIRQGREVIRRLIGRIEGRWRRAARERMKKGNGGRYTRRDLKTLWEIQGGRCYFTGRPLGDSFEEGEFHVDHLTPLAAGGGNGPVNLALVTPACNRGKRARGKYAYWRILRPTKRAKALVRSA